MAITAIILAAGQGTRMKSSLPKVLHKVGGRPMVGHVLSLAGNLGAAQTILVTGPGATSITASTVATPDLAYAVQDPPQGTADAVSAAVPMISASNGIALILYADTPLVTTETAARLVTAVEAGAGLAVLGFEAENPGAYGRLIAEGEDDLVRIVEAKDASPDELAVSLCNSGLMAVDLNVLKSLLPRIDNNNAKGEYYLTDLAALVRDQGLSAKVVMGTEEEVMGVNTRGELAAAEAVLQRRLRQAALEDGVTFIDPDTVYLSADTKLAADTVVEPNVIFGPGVIVTGPATIKAFSHIEGAVIDEGAMIGPFARVRPGTNIGAKAKIGNFVETKKADLGPGAKVSHLSYIGDATVGADANIGAGTITCNYDGYEKFQTQIGAGAFIGSNSSLVAPVTVADGAYVGSGSVITKEVPADSLSVARGRQITKEGWALSFRSKKERPDGEEG